MNANQATKPSKFYRRLRVPVTLLAVGVLSAGCARFMEPEPLSRTASIVTGTEVTRDPSFKRTASGFGTGVAGGSSEAFGASEIASDGLAPGLGEPFSLDDLTTNDANLPELRGIDFGREASLAADLALPISDTATQQDFVRDIGDTVNFETNSSELSEASREILRRQAAWLTVNTDATVQIEGHADERGTRDYNLALGDRRASAVRGYMIAIGIDEGRITKISYGKERPIALGSDEASWAVNRRGVTVVEGGNGSAYSSGVQDSLSPLDGSSAFGTITYDPAPATVSENFIGETVTFDSGQLDTGQFNSAPLESTLFEPALTQPSLSQPTLFEPLPATPSYSSPSTATRIEDVSVDDLLRDPSLIDRLGAPQPGS